MAKKLERPLVIGGNEAYPLTTADQIIMSDGSRLDKSIESLMDNKGLSIELDGSENSGRATTNNADSLGGIDAKDYATKEYTNATYVKKNDSGIDLLWTNQSPTTTFAAQTISVDTSKYKAFVIISGCSTSATDITYPAFCVKGYSTRLRDVGTYRLVTIGDTGIVIGSVANNDNSQVIPVQIYGIK